MASASQYRDLLASSPTLRQFLNLIGWAEGADYNIGWGKRIIPNLAWHPYNQRQFRINDPVTGRPSTTSVAGKYQFQRGTWDEAAKALGLKDFSPASQDLAAVWLLDNRGKGNGQLQNVLQGNVATAVERLKPVWQGFVTRPLSAILDKWNNVSSTSKYPIPQQGVNAMPINDYSQYQGVEVFGAKNRYLIAFAILVIIFIFAFN